MHLKKRTERQTRNVPESHMHRHGLVCGVGEQPSIFTEQIPLHRCVELQQLEHVWSPTMPVSVREPVPVVSSSVVKQRVQTLG
jgi:hypothetical protein